MTRRVPELSLQHYIAGSPAQRTAFEQALFAGLQDYGFIILSDHGVAESLLDEAYATAEAFFALPLAAKLACRGGLRGYTPFGIEHAKDHAVPDLKEFFQVGRDPALGAVAGENYPANVWPTALPAVADVFGRLYAALDDAAGILLRALAPALQVPPEWFAERVAAGNSVLRVIHYPPVAADAEPGAVRSAAHEDINLLTLLVAARGGGLQLLDRDGSWLPVETNPRNLIVDSGDMMARLTNGVIPATTHRVVNPGDVVTGIANTSRYSIPFFVHPTNATPLAALPACITPDRPLRYPPTTAGEYLEQRLREIGLAPTAP
ncbi:MAG: isopenicillin N synthase family dioxygenase [Gammaproteobacteria bacterium]